MHTSFANSTSSMDDLNVQIHSAAYPSFKSGVLIPAIGILLNPYLEDWDDSTVSSNISKMRIQNKLAAMTRRERALAYAFSQQLRICSKKKQAKLEGMEENMSWSWLERWMATRVPESSLVENNWSKQFEPMDSNGKFVVRKRIIDVAGEEKESCGSNEVSVHLETLSVTTPKENDGNSPSKNRLNATRSISRRKTGPSYQLSKKSGKVGR
ncbi:hypothetical protein QQP08_003721 [Theobroma cacao]|nr:hypothetical protein QQP08_003721 [Theobroma cacao]